MDMSNKSLAFLLVVAIAMSVFSTLVVMNKMTDVGLGPSGMAPTDTGTSNLTIETTYSINFDVDNINFGTGYIIGGSGNCVLDSNGTSNASPNDQCSGFNVSTNPFLINNTGNTDALLELHSSHNATNFTGGTGAALQWWMEENEAGSCTDQLAPFNTGWQDVNTTGDQPVCGDDGFESDDTDTLYLHMRVLIPNDATEVGTERIATITATAS